MVVYSYLIYCANEGASHSNPFRPIYTKEEIMENLHRFKYQLIHCFNQAEPEIEDIVEGVYGVPLPAVKVRVISDENETIIQQALKCSLKGLDLFATKL